MQGDVRVMNELVREESAFLEPLMSELEKVIVGQTQMIERILVGLLTGGHVLLEGVPGLAKTLTINTVASAIDAPRAKNPSGTSCVEFSSTGFSASAALLMVARGTADPSR